MQTVTGLTPMPDPGLPLQFGLTPTAPRNSVPAALGGGLDAASDSGVAGDGVTNDGTPGFSGTAPAGAVVRLLVRPEGSTGQIVAAQTTAGADGRYALTSAALPDGAHGFVLVTQGSALGGANLSRDLGTIRIDTQAPEVASVRVDARTGRVIVGLRHAEAVEQGLLEDPELYQIRRYLGRHRLALRVSDVAVERTAGDDGIRDVALTLGYGRRLGVGRYGLALTGGRIGDEAGNALGDFGSRWTINPRRPELPQTVAASDVLGPVRPLRSLRLARARLR
jgi:hypothetical protein